MTVEVRVAPEARTQCHIGPTLPTRQPSQGLACFSGGVSVASAAFFLGCGSVEPTVEPRHMACMRAVLAGVRTAQAPAFGYGEDVCCWVWLDRGETISPFRKENSFNSISWGLLKSLLRTPTDCYADCPIIERIEFISRRGLGDDAVGRSVRLAGCEGSVSLAWRTSGL